GIQVRVMQHKTDTRPRAWNERDLRVAVVHVHGRRCRIEDSKIVHPRDVARSIEHAGAPGAEEVPEDEALRRMGGTSEDCPATVRIAIDDFGNTMRRQ